MRKAQVPRSSFDTAVSAGGTVARGTAGHGKRPQVRKPALDELSAQSGSPIRFSWRGSRGIVGLVLSGVLAGGGSLLAFAAPAFASTSLTIPAGATATISGVRASGCDYLTGGYAVNGGSNTQLVSNAGNQCSLAYGSSVNFSASKSSRTIQLYLTDHHCGYTYYSDGSHGQVSASTTNPSSYSIQIADQGGGPCFGIDTRSGDNFAATLTITPDTEAPTFDAPADQTVEASGANGAPVSWTTPSATDAVDDTDAVSCASSGTPALHSGDMFPLGATSVACTSTDAAGNTRLHSFTVTVQDTTAPAFDAPADQTVEATGANGAPVAWTTPSASDAVDGTDAVGCASGGTPALESADTFPLGVTTVTCTSTDAAGNTRQHAFNVGVTYGWSGILQPVNRDGSSIFKLGSTVPLKFALTGASAGVTNASATLGLAKVASAVDGSSLEAVSTSSATSGNFFRYDANSGQYIFNWSTKGLAVGTYRLSVSLGDGVVRTATVSLK